MEDERFCAACGMPLVAADGGEAVLSEREQRARKVKPQLAEGPLVKVAGARNQAEAEFVQGLLLEEGVPSTLRRTAGFDVPDFLAAGPRDVMVPRSGVDTARDVLLQADLGSVLPAGDRTDPPWRVAAVMAGALVLLAVLVLLVL